MSRNKYNIMVGSVNQYLNKRLILGDTINNEMVVLINNLFKALEYAENQYNNGATSYESTIITLNEKIFDIRYACPDICNYREFGELIDYRTSNMNIKVSSEYYKESQLQIIYPPA